MFKHSHACPAWGKICFSCNTKNHFASACRQPKKTESANALIAEIPQQNLHPQSISAINNTNIAKIPAQLSFPSSNTPNSFTPELVLIFPDSGASICIARTQHLPKFNIDKQNLLQWNKTITAVGATTLNCRKWIPNTFTINSNTNQQPLYICDKVNKIYLSCHDCIDTNILPKSFPSSIVPTTNKPTYSAITENKNNQWLHKPPPRPTKLPYPLTTETIPLLEKYILEQFKNSTCNKSTRFHQCQPNQLRYISNLRVIHMFSIYQSLYHSTGKKKSSKALTRM